MSRCPYTLKMYHKLCYAPSIFYPIDYKFPSFLCVFACWTKVIVVSFPAVLCIVF